MARPRMDAFTRAYFEAALWSSNDESDEQGGEPLDKNYSIDDIDDATLDKMIADCASFQERFGELIDDDDSPDIQKHGSSELAGYDFWMTRNGHGVGFWEDSDWPKHGEELDQGAKEYGEFYLYVGDDGLIYGPPPGAHGVRERGRRVRTSPTAQWTVEPGRHIHFDGQPFVHIDKEQEALPVEADNLTHFIVEALNQARMTPDELYKRTMGFAPRQSQRRSRR